MLVIQSASEGSPDIRIVRLVRWTATCMEGSIDIQKVRWTSRRFDGQPEGSMDRHVKGVQQFKLSMDSHMVIMGCTYTEEMDVLCVSHSTHLLGGKLTPNAS